MILNERSFSKRQAHKKPAGTKKNDPPEKPASHSQIIAG
jgi:hypothetical protein